MSTPTTNEPKVLASTPAHEIVQDSDGEFSVRALPSGVTIFGPVPGIQGAAECALHIADTEVSPPESEEDEPASIGAAIFNLESQIVAEREAILRNLADQLALKLNGRVVYSPGSE